MTESEDYVQKYIYKVIIFDWTKYFCQAKVRWSVQNKY